MEIAWSIVGVVAALLVGVGVSMVGLSPPEYPIARICFCLSAVLLGGTCMVWEFRTQQPIWWRISAGVLVWVCVGVGTPELLRWVGRRQSNSLPSTNIEVPKKLKVVSLAFVHPHLAPRLPIAVKVNIKNISGKSIMIRNATYTQTRELPKDIVAERQSEDALWKELLKGLETQGRDALIPMVEDGDMNLILESGVLTFSEYKDMMRGSHAVYFASIIRDRETGESLLEQCFFVGRAGIIQYCSTHNGP